MKSKGSLVLDRMLALSTDSQVTAPCGCELFRSGSDGKSVTFRYCNTHAQAPALLKALKHVRATLDGIMGDSELLETYLPLLLKDVRAAIEAAK